MPLHLARRRSVIALAIGTVCASFPSASAQTAAGWKGTGANTNWTTVANWDNTGPNAGARDLFFGVGWVNAGRTGSITANNDISGYHGHKIFFENITSPVSFTLTGNSVELFDFGGATPVYPQIHNSSGATQVFNLPVILHDTSANQRGEINANNGDVIFNNTVDLAGITQLQSWGNNQKTITFNAPITSSGNSGSNSFAITANTNILIKAACTYLGSTFVNAGKLQFDSGGSITSTIRLGDTSGTNNAAVDLITPTGGLTLSRTINPRAGSTNNSLSFNSLNTSGTNTYSGHVGMDHDFLVAQTAGGSLTITQLRATPTDTLTGYDIKGFNASFFAAGDIHVSGTIYNSTGNGNIIKNGTTGTMILSSDNTYTGVTTINEGTLQIGAGTTSGSIAPASVITATGVGGTLTFNRSDSMVFANLMSGAVNLAQTGSGTTILTGINSLTGHVFIGSGTLQIGAGTSSGALSEDGVTNNSNLAFNKSGTFNLVNIVGGSGNVAQNGSGTFVISGAQTYTGHTCANNGTTQIGSGVTPTSLQSDALINNAAVRVASNVAINLAMQISGNGALYQVGTGTTTLLGDNNSFTGTTTITTGTLQIGAGTTSGTLGVGPVTNNAMLVIYRSDTVTIANDISGTGSFAQAGAGTTALTGTNTYTGGTSATAGTLVVSQAASLGGSGALSASGGNVVMSQGFTSGVKVASIGIGSANIVDQVDNKLVVGSATALLSVVDYIRGARNGGAWNGSGLTSTAAKNHPTLSTTLGVLSGLEFHGIYGAGAPFGGVEVDDTDTLVRYTWYGDSDFNGKVDGADYARIDTTFNNEASQGDVGGWFNGDWDFNGKVDGADYALIDAAFNSQSGTIARAGDFLTGVDAGNHDMDSPALQMVQQHFAQFGSDYAYSFLNSIPEPVTCSVLIIPTAFARNRRRRE